jgi:hypothetical protein
MARSQLLSFPYPLEAGLCPYIAGPALPAIPSRGPFFLLSLFSRVCGRGVLFHYLSFVPVAVRAEYIVIYFYRVFRLD